MGALKLVSTENMPHHEWLQWRKKGIGGSDAGAVAGFSKYRSPVVVWLEKTGKAEASQEESQAARFGRKLEPIVADEFAERTGLKIEPIYEMLAHEDYPFMLANLDRLIHMDGELGVLECKTADKYLAAEWDEEKMPDHYYLQVQHYLAVTGLKFAYIAVLIGGNDFRYKRIDRNDEVIAHLIKIESDFWNLVEEDIPPAVDGTESTTEMIRQLYPESNGQEIILPEVAMDWLDQYHKAAAKVKEYELLKTEAQNKIMYAMQDYAIGWIGEKKVTRSVIAEKQMSYVKKAHTRLYLPRT
ncbi:lambda-exonuclease family protein [Brevibacillus sp. 1238]|uniref:YqaJ viral recombinase family nuclease n=1 Tax=Brevibacillus sp. 1238 TaxID=2940565 RepID=UPI002474909E|nr:YqaJ viral recombinase family protein [Brevibacillus sp. 1238]MDH6351889.1 putative phage-type endonuclease [Brevibacillus sp. 1238]